MKVFKYTLPFESSFLIDAPSVFEPIHVEEQHGKLCLWAIVDPDFEIVPHRFHIVGTGHEMIDVGKYVGTAVRGFGGLVWHVFRGKED